ncbi:TetR/AcrR family transcriptional regulator C-terminal domain-containing protein [Pseudonocardia kujensis]|uniref:TetR/AcrR family transcriptional regulator C-terminal domain-containing protein n=1 Tax=Pseudonocardia kujensis TaxID=1128675 RepID=UPI001E2EE155|nr:TetR/AcrR family transcriptional regulator C-terminal domain-containing protein [Pseudonocardia kujensis]MCE0762284.1 TetR/AcrR family transcriptional regulator C-terminal domain-containing protein [Pseudonocardia kujensis]
MSRGRPRLDRQAIVAATLEALDERGLDRLSSHAVAARLGVRQPALYHHFRDMAELLAAVAAEVLDRWHTERLPKAGENWDSFLLRNARSMRRAMLAVRDGARLIATAGARAPNPANSLAQVSFLEGHGFSGPDAVLAAIAVSRYTIGSTLEQQSARDGTAILVPGEDELPGADRFARIAETVAELGPDHEFEIGLAALVRGLAPSPRRGAEESASRRGSDPAPPVAVEEPAPTSDGR